MLLETDHILPSLKLPDLIHSNKRNEKDTHNLNCVKLDVNNFKKKLIS